MATFLIELSPRTMRADSTTRWACTSTRCATRAAPRASGHRCGWNTPIAGAAGRRWRPWRSPIERRRPWRSPIRDGGRGRSHRRPQRVRVPCSGWPTATAAPRPVVAAAGQPGSAPRRRAARGDRPADEQLLPAHRLHIHPAPRAAASVRRWPAGCSPTAARPMCCCPPEIIGEANRAWRLYRRLGFTDIIRAATSPAIPGPSRSWAARCRSDGLLRVGPAGNRVWHDTPRA